jgi:hypothetical protein
LSRLYRRKVRPGLDGLIANESVDNEGNFVGAVFSWDEWTEGAWCGDCHEMIIEPDATEEDA